MFFCIGKKLFEFLQLPAFVHGVKVKCTLFSAWYLGMTIPDILFVLYSTNFITRFHPSTWRSCIGFSKRHNIMPRRNTWTLLRLRWCNTYLTLDYVSSCASRGAHNVKDAQNGCYDASCSGCKEDWTCRRLLSYENWSVFLGLSLR